MEASFQLTTLSQCVDKEAKSQPRLEAVNTVLRGQEIQPGALLSYTKGLIKILILRQKWKRIKWASRVQESQRSNLRHTLSQKRRPGSTLSPGDLRAKEWYGATCRSGSDDSLSRVLFSASVLSPIDYECLWVFDGYFVQNTNNES